LAVTLLSNCAESRLRAAVQALTALETHTPVSCERETEQLNPAGDEQQEAASLSRTALVKLADEHLTSALADAVAALDVGLDGGIQADGNNISDKSRRRVKKAADMIANSQATRLGDSIEPRSAKQIAAGNIGGCADKLALEAAITRTWEVGAHQAPTEVEATCVQKFT
jgi:hypothetical protein